MQLANNSPSRLERIYLQQEDDFGLLPQVGGVSVLSGSDASRHIRCVLQPEVKAVQRPDKTGTRTTTPTQAGRLGGKWKLELSLAANGVAGQRPDCDPLLAAVMGQNGIITSGSATVTIASNTSPITVGATNTFSEFDVVTLSGVDGAAGPGMNGTWTILNVTPTEFTLLGSESSGSYTTGGFVSRQGIKYGLSDSLLSFALWRFRQPSSLQQMTGIGCVVHSAQFLLGQDVARWQAEGDAKWVLDSNEAPYADVDQLGGLTTFPNEPATPVTNGNFIAGFQGSIVIDGDSIATLRSATIQIAPKVTIPQEYFGTSYGQEPEAGPRSVSIAFDMREDDSLALQNLYHKALTKTPIDIALQAGTTPGSTFVFILRGVQLDMPSLEDGPSTFTRKFTASPAHGSSAASLDEITIWAV